MVIACKFLTPTAAPPSWVFLVWELLCGWVYNLDRQSPLQNHPGASVTSPTKLHISAVTKGENKASVAARCEGVESFLLPQQRQIHGPKISRILSRMGMLKWLLEQSR